jgi:hypothetical protein
MSLCYWDHKGLPQGRQTVNQAIDVEHRVATEL